MKVCLISLGCPKNLVDSEIIAGRLSEDAGPAEDAGPGIEIVYDPEDADVAVVNTCGFIRDAVEESEETIRDLCRLKEAGLLRGVVVAGCLVQRFGTRLRRRLPGVNAFLEISDYSRIVPVIRRILAGPRARARLSGGEPRSAETDLGRAILTPPHTSYLRIAEGCNHRCSFCAIPSIRGRLRSRPVPVLVEETRQLARLGVKELNLVAEDTTDYGRDLKEGYGLPELLDALSAVRGIRWIRILYAYPSRVTDALIGTIAGNPKVMPYIDVPVQHASATILSSMRRGTSPAMLRRLVRRLREGVPGIAIRTSVIVGYPGETEERFEKLFDFVREARFERLGAFAFSPEAGTAAHALRPRPSRRTVEERVERLMEFQRTVVEERNNALVGREADAIVDVLYETGGPGGLARGRTEADAPDIDCSVLIRGRNLRAGDIIRVRFTGTEGYDLIARSVPRRGGPEGMVAP